MIGYQLFVVIISVLGLATEEFVTKEALGIFEQLFPARLYKWKK